MARPRTVRRARPRNRRTRRSRGKVLDVRSPKHIKDFERLMSSGPLTMVFIKAQWCGACHRFNDEVWKNLTNLPNRNMNLASVDSEVIGKTSLANVPRKYYPTLLLVGKDKKPATFLDEDGSPTNAMPRNNSLEEDREALSALVQNPTAAASTTSPMNTSMNTSMNTPMNTPMGTPMENSMDAPVENSMDTPMASPMASPMDTPMNSQMPMAKSTSVPRSNTTKKSNSMSSLTRSPFTPKQASIPLEALEPSAPILSTSPSPIVLAPSPRMNPPDIGSDLVASQTQSPTGTAGVIEQSMRNTMRGGSLLKAIRNQTASLKAMLNLRNPFKNTGKTRRSYAR